MKGNRLPTTGSVNINQLNLEFRCQFSIQQKTNLHPEKTLNIPFVAGNLLFVLCFKYGKIHKFVCHPCLGAIIIS